MVELAVVWRLRRTLPQSRPIPQPSLKPRQRRQSKTLSHLIKSDLLAALNELLCQDPYDLALKVFYDVRSEYKIEMSSFADMVLGLNVFITDCGEIGVLKLLNFSRNRLDGSLPTFHGFVGLQFLDLSYNLLKGNVDLQFDGLFGLKSLNISLNHFH